MFLGMSLCAQTLKIASIAPESTPWGQGLNQMAAEWSKITNGRVRLQIFHGGVAGNEVDIVRKMRLGQVHGAASSPLGLNTLVPLFWGLLIPGIIQTGDELDYLLEELEEDFSQTFRDEGYEIMTWSNSGWLKFFTRDAVRKPGDLRGQKIATTGYDEGFNTILRNLGMQTVSTSSAEVLTGLNSGLIDALIYAPLGVAGFQWFAVADNMLELQIAPFFGAIVIDSRSWKRIPQQYHEELKESAEKIGKQIVAELDELEREGVELMQSYGLNVANPSGTELEQWYELFESARKDLEDEEYFSSSIMTKVRAALEEFRSR